jgi:hypothetical protein
MTLRSTLAIGLLAAALVLLGLGGFVQLDDTSGFGDQQWNLPLGLLAGLLGIAGIVAGAIGESWERRTTGWAVATIAVCVLAVDAVTPGFRFVWGESEGEGAMLQVGLVLTAAALLLPGRGRSDGRRRVATGTWATAWLLGLAVAVPVAFVAGMGHFEATQCSGAGFDGECDVAALEGLLWAGGAAVLGVLAWVADGVRRSRR